MNSYAMPRLILLLVGFLAATGALAEGAGKVHGRFVQESVEISNHVVFNTTDVVDGATILVRDFHNGVIHATVSTAALTPNWAYSIWWAVFNHPRFCTIPHQCAVADLEINGGDPRVKASVFWGGGLIADASGVANTSLQLVTGRTDRELFANSKNYGLMNFAGAEIHLVLRSHGSAGVWGTIAQQVGTAGEACPTEGCMNTFASFHPSRD
jgi:hypothetical protein